MTKEYRSFVILAGMRTGSNLLEATLNGIRGVTCHGEAFNPYFMGWPETTEIQGYSLEQREADPLGFLRHLLDRPGHLPGFRYFFDHDPRIFDAFMADRDCAKIILTRNPLESHVSAKLAWQTNQWKLNATETPVAAQVTYDGAEFREALAATTAFLTRISRALQVTGQCAFRLDYRDLRDPMVLTGLLHWLGRDDLVKLSPAKDQMPQNPRGMAEKVVNFTQMRADLGSLDPFDTEAIPRFEPERGPAVRSYQASEAGQGLVFLPITGGPTDGVQEWLAGLGPICRDYRQTTLREWKRAHPGHRSFAVLRHPLRRAYAAFLDLIETGSDEMRRALALHYGVVLPEGKEGHDSDLPASFHAFLGFLRRNLNGQTSLPTPPIWASQAEVIAGFARQTVPDMLIREERLDQDLRLLASMAGIVASAGMRKLEWPDFLNDPRLTDAAQSAYLRDYIAFGFDRMP